MHFNFVGSPSRNAHLPVVQFGTSGKILTRSAFSVLMPRCIFLLNDTMCARCFLAPLSLKFPRRWCCGFVFQRKLSSETIMVRAWVGRQNLLETIHSSVYEKTEAFSNIGFVLNLDILPLPLSIEKKQQLIFHSPPLWLSNASNTSCTPFCCALPCP